MRPWSKYIFIDPSGVPKDWETLIASAVPLWLITCPILGWKAKPQHSAYIISIQILAPSKTTCDEDGGFLVGMGFAEAGGGG